MRVLCLVPVLLLGQTLAAQTPESTGITMSGRVVSTVPVHHLALAPEGGSRGKSVYQEVAPDGTFKIDGLTMGHYRLSLVPPIEPGAEVPVIEVRDLTGAELVIYDEDHADERVIAQPGLSERRTMIAGTVAPLGAFAVGVRIERFHPDGGGTNVDVRLYRALVLEFRGTTRTSDAPAQEQTGVPR